MDLLKRLTFKNLKLNKRRTIVTIIGIMLSVALITAVAGVYMSGIASIRNYEMSILGHYHVGFNDVKGEDLAYFDNNKKIESAFVFKEEGASKCDEITNEYKPYIRLLGATDEGFDKMNIKVKAGRYPKNDSEIILCEHINTTGGTNFEIGDNIELNLGSRFTKDGSIIYSQESYYGDGEEKIENTESKQYKIVGICDRPNYNIEDYSSAGYTAFTYDDKIDKDSKGLLFITFNKKGLKDRYNILSKFTGVSAKSLKKVIELKFSSDEDRENASKEFDEAKYYMFINSFVLQTDVNPMSFSGVDKLGIIVFIVCGIIVFAAVFCIKNAFDISVTEKIKQYGMLRSIGATKKQIRKNVTFEAIVLEVIGIPLGLLLGNLATFILMILTQFLIGDQLEGVRLVYEFSLYANVFAVLLGIITVHISAFGSSRKAAKVSAIDSIRNSGQIKINPKKIKSPKIVNKLFGIGGVISHKSIKRNKKRYRTTIISIVISVTIFMALSYIVEKLYESVKQENVKRNYNISGSVDIDNDRLDASIEDIKKIKGIKRCSFSYWSFVEYLDNEFTDDYLEHMGRDMEDWDNYLNIVSLDEDEYKKFVEENNLSYDECKDAYVFINYQQFYEYDYEKQKTEDVDVEQFVVNKGDEITVRASVEGNYKKLSKEEKKDALPFEYEDEDGKKIIDDEIYYKDVKIKIADVVIGKLPFGYDTNTIGSAFIVCSMNTGKDYWTYKSADSTLRFAADTTEDVVFEKHISEMVNNNTDKFDVDNYTKQNRQLKNILLVVSIFLYGFIAVISLIGISNIFNTITTNMQLRAPEFAMLKSVGMTKKEFDRMIGLESIFIGAKSILWGFLFGIIAEFGMYKLFEIDEIGERFIPSFMSMLISFVVIMLVIVGIMKFSLGKIRKQNIIETIRNENI